MCAPHYAVIPLNGHMDSIQLAIMMMTYYRYCKTAEKFWRDYFGDNDAPVKRQPEERVA